ncbi:MAG: enoyl-CoA hydratase/isomerase family protein [Candidatus Eisenbacteria bacterium]|uniref:Enoyl-CoA hydratase/isomerase family protein n=1 Tax=Eiseniibacteriota bacterium TaxID=2212470 RepID=A0A849SXN1_UNCEI|nr:enoyl-CoA hydratase/isomerase family protein [Candidatus Eisenbacteria bacterium]
MTRTSHSPSAAPGAIASEVRAMRGSTIETLGLGSVHGIFSRGRLPADAGALVDQVFGERHQRGSFVVSGASGIVGAGKTLQLGSRLEPFGVRAVALDFAGAPDGLGRHYPGLVQAFGRDGAARIMSNTVRLSYDGQRLPDELASLRPRFLLEAIPEILEVKKAHYAVFRAAFPGLEIRSVTSGFPSRELGVGIAHPAFPHEINKVWETVEPTPSALTQLFWALGMIPVPVSDHWSFVLDVLFCGITLAGLHAHRDTNLPFWKIDKLARRLVGPNPFRAHDAIGSKGADFLTWSCLHHLSEHYGALFTPTAELTERKDTGQAWYPPDHFRPLVDWTLSDAEREDFRVRLLGPIFQMTSLLLHERRAPLAHVNAIGELCAQFRSGPIAMLRAAGPDAARATVEAWHRLHPEAAASAWHPEALASMESAEWQQLYVNAEHDGRVGVVSLSRESYSWDVDRELDRALDWLSAAGIRRVIVSGDFHFSTQMVGADTAEFFSALERLEDGLAITNGWSRTARRLWDEFEVSVAFVNGKRCLGGMLEAVMHCHHVVAVDDVRFGWPEVTLPVVPGMEACHWPFRRTTREHWPRLLHLLLSGAPIKAKDAVGWLIDVAAPIDEAIATAWRLASAETPAPRRPLELGALNGVPTDVAELEAAEGPAMAAGREAIARCVARSCAVPAAEALALQAQLAAEFLASAACREGRVGAEAQRVMRT